MILVDSSVWIDHFDRADARLADLIRQKNVMVHPFVIGEVILGHVSGRDEIVEIMSSLPRPTIPSHYEVFDLILTGGLVGAGIGLVDAHLVAAAKITPEAQLWTRDKKLRCVAERLGVAADTD